MRLNGYDFDAKPLTVRDLKKFITDHEARTGKSLDDYPIHFLAMEETDASGYATHVEIDAFDGTEADPDDPAYRCHFALCLSHEVKP